MKKLSRRDNVSAVLFYYFGFIFFFFLIRIFIGANKSSYSSYELEYYFGEWNILHMNSLNIAKVSKITIDWNIAK